MAKNENGRAVREVVPAPQRAKSAEAQPARLIPLRHIEPGAIVQRALAAPQVALRPAELMALQRSLGNRAVGAMLGRMPVQAKLIVNAPGDQYELEADRMAEAVMREPPVTAHSTVVTMAKPAVEPGGDGSFAASQAFAQRLEARQGRGHRLPPALRETFETRFGADFSDVRVHSDSEAGQLSNAIQAQAFTRGSDIYWGAGTSGADTLAGKRLLAHELAHVVQQGAAPATSETAPRSVIQPKAEAGPSGLFASGSVSVGQLAGVTGPGLSRMVQPKSEGAIQRKIEVGKLNLVGEDHEESGPRRPQEQDMLQENYHFSSTQYWTEAEFKLPNNTYGDPKDLRVLQAATYMLASKDDAKNDRDTFYSNFRMFESGMEEYKQQQPLSTNDPLVTNATPIINEIKKRFGSEVVVDRDQLEYWRKSIRSMLNKFSPFSPRSGDVRWERSKYMLQAAEASNEPGVWKVGDDHITDILKMPDAIKNNTTLTSQGDFNDEFHSWLDYDMSYAFPTTPSEPGRFQVVGEFRDEINPEEWGL